MKFQKFEITFAIPDKKGPIRIDDMIDVLRDNTDEFGAVNCAIEGTEVGNDTDTD